MHTSLKQTPPLFSLLSSFLRTVQIVKTVDNPGENNTYTVDAHNYVVFGGTFWQFACAATQRFCCGLNLHPRGSALFWINMQGSARYLDRLRELCDDHGVKPKVDADA